MRFKAAVHYGRLRVFVAHFVGALCRAVLRHLDFSTKWPTKFADKVSKRRHNEQTKREGRVAGPNNFLEFCAGVRLTRTGRYRGGS
jgi:hypothetical protein